MTAAHERNETFEVEDDHLIRRVVPRRGEPYEHRCPCVSFEQVAQEGPDRSCYTSSAAGPRSASGDLPKARILRLEGPGAWQRDA